MGTCGELDITNNLKNISLESETGDTEVFYDKAEKYWATIDPNVNGVLGGFGWISDVDIRGSDKFLTTLIKSKEAPGVSRALDCGAGVGRITTNLLVRHFREVDLVEQNSAFLDKAREELHQTNHVGNFYPCSLRTFTPDLKYDVIWCQWVLGHLTDSDLIAFLQRCASSLQSRGVIIIKENISSDEVICDEVDSSVTRPCKRFLSIFQKASLRVIRQANQNNFPDGLFSVKIFALRPLAPPLTRSLSKSSLSRGEMSPVSDPALAVAESDVKHVT